MFRVMRFRLLALTVVLAIAVASVAGITFSSNSAGGKNIVTAIRYSDLVHFAIQNLSDVAMQNLSPKPCLRQQRATVK